MAESKGGSRGCLTLAIGGVLATGIGCCGLGGAAVIFGPGWAMSTITSTEVLSVPDGPIAPETSDEVMSAWWVDLEDDRTVRITPEQLNRVLQEEMPPEAEIFQVRQDGENLAMDVSWRLDPAKDEFVNVQIATDFVLEHGWFTELTMDEMSLGDWDLGIYITGQDLSADANRSLADERSDPEVARALDAMERVEFTDGAIVLTMTEDGYQELMVK